MMLLMMSRTRSKLPLQVICAGVSPRAQPPIVLIKWNLLKRMARDVRVGGEDVLGVFLCNYCVCKLLGLVGKSKPGSIPTSAGARIFEAIHILKHGEKSSNFNVF
jgi:hypothetical protein